MKKDDETRQWIRARLKQYRDRERAAFAEEVHGGNDREWWRTEARAVGTDWSTLLRQRIKVLAWIRAGRPPIAEWRRKNHG